MHSSTSLPPSPALVLCLAAYSFTFLLRELLAKQWELAAFARIAQGCSVSRWASGPACLCYAVPLANKPVSQTCCWLAVELRFTQWFRCSAICQRVPKHCSLLSRLSEILIPSGLAGPVTKWCGWIVLGCFRKRWGKIQLTPANPHTPWGCFRGLLLKLQLPVSRAWCQHGSSSQEVLLGCSCHQAAMWKPTATQMQPSKPNMSIFLSGGMSWLCRAWSLGAACAKRALRLNASVTNRLVPAEFVLVGSGTWGDKAEGK